MHERYKILNFDMVTSIKGSNEFVSLTLYPKGKAKSTAQKNLACDSEILAGAIGIEPTLRESEARVLPLHQAPPIASL